MTSEQRGEAAEEEETRACVVFYICTIERNAKNRKLCQVLLQRHLWCWPSLFLAFSLEDSLLMVVTGCRACLASWNLLSCRTTCITTLSLVNLACQRLNQPTDGRVSLSGMGNLTGRTIFVRFPRLRCG